MNLFTSGSANHDSVELVMTAAHCMSLAYYKVRKLHKAGLIGDDQMQAATDAIHRLEADRKIISSIIEEAGDEAFTQPIGEKAGDAVRPSLRLAVG